MKTYTFNLETKKIELYFEKEEYLALSETQKKMLKSAFLWSSKAGGWVSRAIEPNLWKAKQTAKELGFTEEVRTGERLSFAEQVERKAERAEERAERYEKYAVNAEKRGKQLCSDLESHRGDVAFFTQPIINSSSGRAFSNYRERLYKRFDSGMDEYRKSEYFAKKAVALHSTALNEKYKNLGYLDRRIKECEKEIRARFRNIEEYEKQLKRLDEGEVLKTYTGELITTEQIEERINYQLELIEVAEDKLAYLKNLFDEYGGGRFSQANIKIGYVVKLNKYRKMNVKVVGTGPINFTYKTNIDGIILQASYAEILEIVSETEDKNKHPFVVGEKFSVPVWTERKYVDTEFEIISVTDSSVKLQSSAGGKPIIRRPSKVQWRDNEWRLSINDGYKGTVYKTANL